MTVSGLVILKLPLPLVPFPLPLVLLKLPLPLVPLTLSLLTLPLPLPVLPHRARTFPLALPPAELLSLSLFLLSALRITELCANATDNKFTGVELGVDATDADVGIELDREDDRLVLVLGLVLALGLGSGLVLGLGLGSGLRLALEEGLS